MTALLAYSSRPAHWSIYSVMIFDSCIERPPVRAGARSRSYNRLLLCRHVALPLHGWGPAIHILLLSTRGEHEFPTLIATAISAAATLPSILQESGIGSVPSASRSSFSRKS